MKSLLQIGVLAVLVYVAYVYYKKNYTEEGKTEKLREQSNVDSLITQKANELREKYIANGSSQCDTIVSPFGTYSTQWARESCKASIMQQAEETDWIAEAEIYFI